MAIVQFNGGRKCLIAGFIAIIQSALLSSGTELALLNLPTNECVWNSPVSSRKLIFFYY